MLRTNTSPLQYAAKAVRKGDVVRFNDEFGWMVAIVKFITIIEKRINRGGGFVLKVPCIFRLYIQRLTSDA